ncbi:MAG: AbrB/MazE/SpoVT family DNA-binding domain-containing protein [Chloroflexi bacterium]|nr:AbrB/MazE/SpoVT family DNA-binding domain-containing protein [Chloroflexota bacterium]
MRQVIELSLDDLGRILIPAPLRQRLGLKPGMTLMVEEAEQGEVQLRVESNTPKLLDEGGILVVDCELLEDLTDVVQRARESRVQELIQRAGM